MSPALYGSAAATCIMWPDMCHLDLPTRNLSCYTFPFQKLSIVYRIIDIVIVDQSYNCRLITTKSAKSTHYHFYCTKTFITCQTSHYQHLCHRFGFCFIYAPFPTTWQFHIFPTSNKTVKRNDFVNSGSPNQRDVTLSYLGVHSIV